MSGPQFTRGPWVASKRHSGEVDAHDGERVASVASMRPGAERWANAQLCASAPDLYAALEDAEFLLRKLAIHPHDTLAMRDSIRGTVEEARSALARARGETA
jgi:hypothetical protein